MFLDVKSAGDTCFRRLYDSAHDAFWARYRFLPVPAAVVGVVVIGCAAQAGDGSSDTASKAPTAASTTAAHGPRTWRAKSNRDMMAMRDGREPGPDFTKRFSKHMAQVKMRDGAEIHTEIYAPLDQAEPLPIILVRSPYGLNPDKDGYAAWLREYPHLMKDGYIFVFQDTRGRGASTGKYVSLSPMRDTSVPNSTDESTDTYDSIDWIIKNVPRNNGRVGTLGISYGGFLTTRALVNPHPALKAASPQATCVDMFQGTTSITTERSASTMRSCGSGGWRQASADRRSWFDTTITIAFWNWARCRTSTRISSTAARRAGTRLTSTPISTATG